MIQRIQSVYLILSAVISVVTILTFNLWTYENNEFLKVIDTLYSERFLIKSIGISFIISAVLSVFTIFNFKNRQNQFVMGRINILINFYLLGVLIIESLNLSGETTVSEKGIGMFTPLICIILLVMANKAIKKDEDLVKSVDRLR